MKSLEPKADQFKQKFNYEKMLVLKPGMLVSESGFICKQESENVVYKVEKIFLECIEEAIKDPQWLLIPTTNDTGQYSAIYKERMGQGLPSAQDSRPEDIKNLQALASNPELGSIARKINNPIENDSGVSSVDIMMRAYEIMEQKYPALCFFRGAEFDSEEGFAGADFSPGSLSTALSYSTSSFGKKRNEPVLVVVKFTDVISAYVRGKLKAYSENNLYRNSLVLYGVKDIKDVKVYRVEERLVDEIIKDFNKKAIKL